MKAILTDDQVLVYSSMEENNISIATLHKGEEMELGKVTRKKTKTWVEISLAGGQKGFIPGETKIFTVRKAQLVSNSVDMMDAPASTANLVKTYTKGSIFTVTLFEKTDEGNWFKVRDEAGQEGFIPSTSTKLKVVQEPTRSGAIRNLITGLIFTVIGVVLTFMNSAPDQANSMIYISYAVIFFGLLQMGQGGVEYYKFTHKKDDSRA